MPKALDQGLRDRVIDAVLKDGMSRRCASERFGVSASTAVKWVQAVEREARHHPVGTGGHRPSALPSVCDWLLSRIEERPDQTLATLCRRLRDEQGVKAVPSMLSVFFSQTGGQLQKTLFASEQDRPDVARRRQQWRKYQKRIAPQRLVFIDETRAKTNMTASHGRGPKGHPLQAKIPGGHWMTMTFIAALRHDGITAPCVFYGPINDQCFLVWVQQFLVPTLKPGDVVILDNLSSHKSEAVRQAIRQAKAHIFFLPPYSPDLNPIEQVFAKLKRLLRRAEERTKEETWRRMGNLLNQFPPQECANYIRNSGYAYT